MKRQNDLEKKEERLFEAVPVLTPEVSIPRDAASGSFPAPLAAVVALSNSVAFSGSRSASVGSSPWMQWSPSSSLAARGRTATARASTRSRRTNSSTAEFPTSCGREDGHRELAQALRHRASALVSGSRPARGSEIRPVAGSALASRLAKQAACCTGPRHASRL